MAKPLASVYPPHKRMCWEVDCRLPAWRQQRHEWLLALQRPVPQCLCSGKGQTRCLQTVVGIWWLDSVGAKPMTEDSNLGPPDMASSELEPMPSTLKTSPTLMTVTAGAGSSFPSHDVISGEKRGVSPLLMQERVCVVTAVPEQRLVLCCLRSALQW